MSTADASERHDATSEGSIGAIARDEQQDAVPDAGADPVATDEQQDAVPEAGKLSPLPERRIYQLFDLSDRSCTKDDDCVAFYASASCTDVCSIGVVSRGKGQASAYEILVSIERDLCRNEPEASAVDRDHGRYSATCRNKAITRCEDGFCGVSNAMCPEGCEPSEGDVCVGDSTCAGCPAFPWEAQDTPCHKAEVMCTYGTACSLIFATCGAPRNGARWEVTKTLCSQR